MSNQYKKMFDPSWLGKVTRKNDLMSKLSDLHEMLRQMPQLEAEDRPSGFKMTAGKLISARILGNSDKDMKLLACCCIVDIYRISAPDIPYSDEEVVKTFEVLVNQLRGLATCENTSSGSGSKIMYILRSLATVNTCVLPVLLASSGVAGAEEVLISIFQALISSIHVDHDEEVSKLMITVMLSCLEECEEVSQELLDVLLQPLLPSFKAENPPAYNMVGRVLQNAPANTQASVGIFINQVLVGAQPGSQNRVAESELTDHIYPLIYEMHRLAPDMLLKVLPNVCTQLQAEEDEIRLKAVKLLGRLFASTFADYGTEFGRNFREFIGRFIDISSAVRLEMVDSAALILRRKPSLRDQVEKPLRERLRDADAEVRQGALQRLVELAQEDPEHLSVATFEEMGLRVKDKRPDIRRGALIGLSKIYSKHVALALPPLHELTDSGDDLLSFTKGSLTDRLNIVPSLVVNSWTYPDQSNKLQVLQLLQEFILPRAPKNGSALSALESSRAQSQTQTQSQARQNTQEMQVEVDGRRASALYLMYSTLGEEEARLLSQIMQYKNNICKELLHFLSARDASTDTRGAATASQTAAMKNALMRLTQILPVGSADKKASVLERLPNMKDRNIYKLLARISRPLDCTTEILRCRDDVRARCDTKSALGEYIGKICDTASYLVVNEDIVDALVNHVSVLKGDSAVTASRLLATLARSAPRAFSACAESMQSWLTNLLGKGGFTSAAIASALEASALFAVLLRGAEGLSEDERVYDLVQCLLKIASQNPDADVCEKAAEAASSLALHAEAEEAHINRSKTKGRLSDAGENVCATSVLTHLKLLTTKTRMKIDNPRLACDLRSIAALVACPVQAQITPKLKYAHCARIQACAAARIAVDDLIRNRLLQADSPVGMDQAPAVSASLEAWTTVLCSELEAEEVSHHEHSDSDVSIDNSGSPLNGGPDSVQKLAEILWGCVDANGSIVGNRSASSTSVRARLYESAVSSALELVRRPSLGKFVSVQAWKKLGWSLLNKDEGMQARLAHQLFSIVQTSGVHLKFLVYPALIANDDRLGYNATQSLLFNVKRMRRTHDVMSQRALVEESDNLQRIASANMPENILPYVLYLLSYHPEFPSDMAVESEVDQRKLKKMASLVRSVVRILVESLGADENNIAFLLKQVNMIQHHYEDRHDKENIGLYFITRLATKILNEMVRMDENVQEYRGDVSLPMELYELRSDDVRPGQRAPSSDLFRAVVADGMQEAEAAMDRALQAGKKAHLPRVGQKRASSAIRRPTKSVSGKHDGHDSATDSEDDAETHPKRKSKTAKVTKATKITRDEGERRQPRRQSVIPVNYREPIESEKEAAQWDRNAGEHESPTRSNKPSLEKEYESSSDSDTVVNNDMDVASAVSPSRKSPVRSRSAPRLVERSENVTKESDANAAKGGKKRGSFKQSKLSAFLVSTGGEENAADIGSNRVPVNARR
eukprot:GSChrysophyteH1.ASY1.ANO1.533.1 assembled CDS